jgi:hypothetical protein
MRIRHHSFPAGCPSQLRVHKYSLHAFAAVLCLGLAATGAWGQQLPAPSVPAAEPAANTEFLRAADEVLAEMSKLLVLPVLEPLKKSVRTREEIREYVLRKMREDEDAAKRHADVRTLEALGLLPKGYPLEQKLIALLTEQIAGVYDPGEGEFFIASWTEAAEQRVIMAHELTHALEDQHFGIEQWSKAAKDNDDAGFARDAVLEGSAMIAMIDYLLRDSGGSFRDLGDFNPALLLGDVEGSQELKDVPLVLRDQLLFPYLAGAAFAAKALEAAGGWPGLARLFERPPTSTQQILHPELYLRGVQPETVQLPALGGIESRGWKKLDENVMGEFGLNQVLKQFLGKERADELAAAWSGDRYAIFEQSPDGPALLVIRLRLAGGGEAARFFSGYSELLEQKHTNRDAVVRRANSFSFETAGGGVFIRCYGRDCLLAEGATRAQFEAMTRSMGWSAVPAVLPATPRAADSGTWQPEKSAAAMFGLWRADSLPQSLPAE